LAPDHTGWTISEQPTLYWYTSKSTVQPVQFTLVGLDAAQPLVDVRIKPPIRAGLHRLSLADHGAKLSPGEVYEWRIAVVADPQQRASDIIAGGAIVRVQASRDLLSKRSAARNDAAAVILAEASLWYDALDALCELLRAEPMNADAQRQRQALLAQVGLTGLALE
jgi:hypothetical protein